MLAKQQLCMRSTLIGLSLRFQVTVAGQIQQVARRGIKQLGVSFGSIFHLFSFERSGGQCS